MNNSATFGFDFLLASISAFTSSNTINTFIFLLDYNFLNFHRRHRALMKRQTTDLSSGNEWQQLTKIVQREATNNSN